MPNFKTLIVIAAMGGLTVAGPALAGDYSDAFKLADANADTVLDRAEFEVFVNAKADAGESVAITVRDNGDYDLYFTQKDVNADGLVDAVEASDGQMTKPASEATHPPKKRCDVNPLSSVKWIPLGHVPSGVFCLAIRTSYVNRTLMCETLNTQTGPRIIGPAL